MRLMVASDIHGSAECCEKLLRRFAEEKAERLLLLGDLLCHGARNALPEGYDTLDAAAMLNSHADCIMAVRGNCDSEVDQAVLDFPITSDYMYLPLDGKLIFATHGHIYGPHRLPPVRSCDLLLCGHTHVPDHYALGTPGGDSADAPCFYSNPGSVSIPKGGSVRSYMIIDGGTLVWKDLDGKEYRRESF